MVSESEKETRGTTGRQAYARACRMLMAAGFAEDDACRAALALLAFCLKKERLRLLLDFDLPLTQAEDLSFADAAGRYAGHEPMAYITGGAEFGGLCFRVPTGVLIPRRDTMTLVGAALARLPEDISARILDLGCGSGAIAAVLASARPNLHGLAVDADPLAVKTAAENLERLGFGERVKTVAGSWFSPLDEGEIFDLILSNPPYLSTAEMDELPLSVKKEPSLALWGGRDGLDAYRRILPGALRHLENGGWCMAEIGWRQAPAVKTLFTGAGFTHIEILRDEGGRDRVVIGQKLLPSGNLH